MKNKNVITLAGGGGSSSTGKSSLTGSQPTKLWRALSAFTMADRLSRFHNGLVCSRSAFTMAEILLSLTIIGVVAAITLPSLTGNINERTWNTQRKALYARFSQAIALMPALNGYGTLKEESSAGASDAVDTAAETFVTDGLSKVLKINNICDSEHLKDCGIPDKITTYSNPVDWPKTFGALNSKMIYAPAHSNEVAKDWSMIDTKGAAFETANGESIVAYYNPGCMNDMAETTYAARTQPYVCANFIYDLNGTKGPNAYGKDIGVITALYPTDSVVVAPLAHPKMTSGYVNISAATTYCRGLGNYRLVNKNDAISLFVNQYIVGIPQTWLLLTSDKGVGTFYTTPRLFPYAVSILAGNRILSQWEGINGAVVVCVARD